MNAITRCTLLAIAIMTYETQNLSGEEIYVVDSSHASVIFKVSHFGYSYSFGRFNQAKGGFVLNREDPQASQCQFIINANSIDTNNKKRDEQLKGSDFLNVKMFDVIQFQSSSVSVEKNEEVEVYTIKGKLTIRGVTRDITIPATKVGEGTGPKGAFRSGFICEAKFKRSDFGMNEMIPNLGDEVEVTMSLEGVRQEAPAE